MDKQQTKALVYIGLIFMGIVIGIIMSWCFITLSIESLVNNVLPNLQIENININLNETALVQEMNKSFGGLK